MLETRLKVFKNKILYDSLSIVYTKEKENQKLKSSQVIHIVLNQHSALSKDVDKVKAYKKSIELGS